MFRGASNINLDAKGRLAIPIRYRELLAQHCNGEIVVTVDTEAYCLLIYPRPEWEEIQQRLQALPSFDAAARRVQRLLIGHATDIQLDANGRLQLTPPLREYAGLKKKTVLMGQGKKFELWDESSWLAHRDNLLGEAKTQEMPASLAGLSL